MKSREHHLVFGLALSFAATVAASGQQQAQQQPMPTNPADLVRTGADQKKALRVGDGIYVAYGFGNTFMVTTSEGNVIIDTSMAPRAPRAKELLRAENAGPIKYIILTHAHGDHNGGVRAWKEPGTEIIAQKNHVEFMNYQTRLAGFFARRNAAQFGLPIPDPGPWAGNYGARIEPTRLFDDKYEFSLGGLTFELYRTPGETPDHLTVWIPQLKAAFVGDNYYESFPNIYTLRGTQPRWALDYINSLNKVLALKPELVLPSHGQPIVGNAQVTRRLTQYRDAIQHVHDEVVKGMNAGKDVFTLMREIKLPPDLNVGESYGNLIWSIRGIYEGYAGWFDLSPATMYDHPPASVHSDVVRLAGGPDGIANLAMERALGGREVEALHLTDIALTADPNHRRALEVRLKALEALRDRSKNSNERGWLDHSISVTRRKLGQASGSAVR
jgi:alkyl sulfatase BDS1-like metallo-beta-lactamase superfamily hydrolase